MGNSLSISLLSYGILEEFDSKTFSELYPHLANDPVAQQFLNQADNEIINPDDIDENILLDDIISIINRDAVML